MRSVGTRRALIAVVALLATAAAPAPKPESGGVDARTADYVFSYSWPAQVEAIPALRAHLAADQAERKRTLAGEAAEARRAAAAAGEAQGSGSTRIGRRKPSIRSPLRARLPR